MHASDPKIFHKLHMPKVMFLCVTARPRPEYDFDGNASLWPFTAQRFTKCSDARTGTVAGETQILESVNVNAEEYRKVMLQKDGVLESMKKNCADFTGSLVSQKQVRFSATNMMELALTPRTSTSITGCRMLTRMECRSR